MPLPFVLAAGAAVAGAYGAKKGYDAYNDSEDAERINRNARRIYNDAKEDLENARERTKNSIECYGSTKFRVYEKSMTPFVESYSKIKHIDFKELGSLDLTLNFDCTPEKLKQTVNTTFDMQEVISGGMSSLGAGGLTGLAAYGGAKMLATASTGTAISTLSGAAATNATLAWFGGGALSAGGLGVAGGTAILGGIVAGPVLAMGGALWASKAKEAKENARANRAQAELAAEQMNTAEVKVNAIQSHFDIADNVLNKLDDILQKLLPGLQNLVEHEKERQLQWKQQIFAKGNHDFDIAKKTLADYDAANKGIVNKIRNLIHGNPQADSLTSSYSQLINFLDSPQFNEFGHKTAKYDRADKVRKIRKNLATLEEDFLEISESLIVPSDDVSYKLFTKSDKEGLSMILSVVQTMSNILHHSMMSDEGEPNEEAKNILSQIQNEEIEKLENLPVRAEDSTLLLENHEQS